MDIERKAKIISDQIMVLNSLCSEAPELHNNHFRIVVRLQDILYDLKSGRSSSRKNTIELADKKYMAPLFLNKLIEIQNLINNFFVEYT